MIQSLGALTTALAAINTKVDSLTMNRAPKAATSPEQPSTSQPCAMENPPTAASSAVPDPSIEEQVRIWVAQQMRESYPSFLANTNDELDGDEEEQPQVTRRYYITSGKLRTADTTAVKQVLWPNELVFTQEDRPAVYDSLSSMAFINGYLTIMSLSMGTLRDKMASHLNDMMENGKTFRWPVVRAYHVAWL